MTVKPSFFAVCDDVRLEIGGKVSIIGMFDTLALPAFPGGANLCVTTRWTAAGPGKAEVSLHMLTPDNPSPLRIIAQNIELQDQEGIGYCSAGTVAKFAWQFHTPGLYHIQVRLDNEEAGSIPLMVRKAPPARPGK